MDGGVRGGAWRVWGGGEMRVVGIVEGEGCSGVVWVLQKVYRYSM